MKNKLILTSFITLCFACPAMAEPTNTGTFPANGLMQEDYTYTNAATSTNMDGVYEGTVLAEAQYVNAEYNLAPGHYLAAGNSEILMCPIGSFCVGSSSAVTYSENNDQIIETCPSSYPDTYGFAGDMSDCFRPCTTSDEYMNHAITVSGNVYYSGGTSCSALSCENGYHLESVYGNGRLLSSIGHMAAMVGGYTDSSGVFHGVDTNALYGGETNNSVNASGVGGISGPNKWGLYFGGLGLRLSGEAFCGTGGNNTSVTSDNVVVAEELIADNGNTCWCKATSAGNMITMDELSDARWISLGPIVDCNNSCSQKCMDILSHAQLPDAPQNRHAVLYNIGHSAPTNRCVPNQITITWTGASQEAIDANEAGSCTYGGDIKTPQSATEIPGKIFKGWRFKAPAD